jgi:hypothetical protein
LRHVDFAMRCTGVLVMTDRYWIPGYDDASRVNAK